MRKGWSWAVATLLVVGCAAGGARRTDAPEPDRPPEPSGPVAVAAAAALTLPPLPGLEVYTASDPLAELSAGRAALAVVPGPVPAGFHGFPLRTGEQILLQGWLDPPLALNRAEAEARLAASPPASETAPRSGALAHGRLSDLRPGWRAVPVDGVSPTPETILGGTYPLAGLISVVYPARAPVGLIARARALAVPTPSPWIRLTVAGDFMLARGVARAIREKGTVYPVERVRDHLASADLSFANLESPIGVKGRPLPGKGIWFRAAPEAVAVLQAAGLDGVTLANNHILDYDSENLLETLDMLAQTSIGYTGAGRTLAEARKPLVLEARGVKVAFLGYSQFADLFFDWKYPRTFAATDSLPGVPGIRADWLEEDIRRAKAEAHVVAVAYHWGEEFQNHPTEEQRRLARLTVDLGADLVLGYHPHAIQGFEVYKQGFIAYSTGNFVMDWQETDLARESMLLDFTVSTEGVRAATVLPVWIQAEQPRILTGPDAERLLNKMRSISSKW